MFASIMAAYYRWQYNHVGLSLAIWAAVLGLSILGLVMVPQAALPCIIFMLNALHMGVILAAHAVGIRLPQWLVPPVGGVSNLPAKPGDRVDPVETLPVSESAVRIARTWRGLSFTKKTILVWLASSGCLGGLCGFLVALTHNESFIAHLGLTVILGPLMAAFWLAIPFGIVILIHWLVIKSRQAEARRAESGAPAKDGLPIWLIIVMVTVGIMLPPIGFLMLMVWFGNWLTSLRKPIDQQTPEERAKYAEMDRKFGQNVAKTFMNMKW
jgi:hypothetical protein